MLTIPHLQIRLEIAENKLTALPEGISRLGELAALNLSGNALTALPAELGQMTVLETLVCNIYRVCVHARILCMWMFINVLSVRVSECVHVLYLWFSVKKVCCYFR